MNYRIKDLTGQKFGKLKVISLNGIKSKRTYWNVICDCGIEKKVGSGKLISGRTKSCGCIRIQDLSGKKYGMLTVINKADTKNNKIYWNISCDCGNKKVIRGDGIRAGITLSCGCRAGKRIGGRTDKYLLYGIWASIKQRCTNITSMHFEDYGGRGIRICEEWKHDFEAFKKFSISSGWAEGLQIDRINNNKGYYPKNCRFVSNRKNSLNKRLLTKSNTSGYQGVSFDKSRLKWLSYIVIRYKFRHLGRFENINEAVKARNNFIIGNNLEHEYKLQKIK